MSGVQTLSSQSVVLFELFKFFTFLLGFWYGKCVFERGSMSKTPQGGGGAKNGWRIQIPMFILFFGGEGGVE